MKITILKENFKKGLNIVEKITGKNLTLPILNNVLIKTEKNFLKLTTTNLELGINYWILAKTDKDGEITIPAKFLSDFISFLPEKSVILESKDMTLHIKSLERETQIKGISSDEFPIIPKLETEDFIEINSIPFCNGLSQVVDFTTLSQIKPEFSGVYFNFSKNYLKLVATDSFRLAEKTLCFEKKTNKEYSFILPQKTVREVINIFSEKEGKIKLYFSPNQVMFEFLLSGLETPHSQIQLISRLIEGEYPDYKEIIPKKYETQIILPRDEFLNQIKAVSLFSQKTNEIKIKINPEIEGIELFSQNPEIGETKSLIKGKINGEPIEVSFNYKFLIEGLLQIKSSEIIFELTKDDGPAIIKPIGDLNYIYMVMPVKSI